jgi:hypothetical protein
MSEWPPDPGRPFEHLGDLVPHTQRETGSGCGDGRLSAREDHVQHDGPAGPHVLEATVKSRQDLCGVFDSFAHGVHDCSEQVVAR